VALGRDLFGSPTLSDQTVIPVPSVKVGPGFSGRSHAPNEFILLSEIKEGVDIYINMLTQVICPD
jgi:acetylornithine deacetylase